MNRYELTYDEIVNSLITNNKDSMFYNCSPNLQVINGEQLREAGDKF